MEWDSTFLGENDSLLQQTPSHIKNQISPISDARTSDDLVRCSCISPKDTSNKENISTIKLEGAKLSVDPLQMKKKKKGGGYNLRKSLAWNKAFFTEEGVLDPLELSMITGTLGNSSQDSLLTIKEEGINFLYEDYQSNIDSADPQALEKNLLKEVSADKKTVYLPPKHKSPTRNNWTSASLTCHKVLPAHSAGKTGSGGGGCPRPLPLSSLKRPANENARQAVMKESKLPRIPVSRLGNSLTSATSKSVLHGSSRVKQKQIAQPFVNIQKNIGLKRSPKSVKNMQTKPKAGSESLPVKLFASHPPRRNAVDSPIYRLSSIQSHAPTAKIADNTGPKEISNNVGPSNAVHSSRGEDGSIPSRVSLPQNTLITGTSVRHKQIPSTKPSGLRMPSPSLGFFCQPKASVSNCGSLRAVEAYIPGSRKVGDLRPPYWMAKIPEVVNDIMQTVDSMVLRSNVDFLSADSHERIREDVGEDGLKEELMVSNETECSEPMSYKQMTTHSINNVNEKFQHLLKHDTKLLFQEDRENDINDNKLLLETEPCGYFTEDGSLRNGIPGGRGSRESTGNDWENSQVLSQQSPLQCTKGLYGTKNTFENSCEEDKPCNSAVTDDSIPYKLPSGDVISCGLENSAMIQSKSLSRVEDNDYDHPYKEHGDRLKSCTDEAVCVPYGGKHLLLEKGNFNKLLGASQICASENIENAQCKTSEHTCVEMGNVDSSLQHKYANQLEECLMTDNATLKSYTEETELQVSDKILTAQNCEGNLNQHLEVDDLNEPSGTCLELQTLFLEQIPQHTHELPAADCLLVEKSMGSEGYLQEVIKILPSVTSEERGKNELDSSDVEVSQVPTGMEGGPFDMNEMSGHGFVEDPALNAVETAHAVKNHDCLLTANMSSDVICNDVPSSAFHSSSNEASKMFGGKCRTFNGNKVPNRQTKENNLMVNQPENLTLFESPHLDPQRAVANCGRLIAESKELNDDQKCNLQSITEADPTLLSCLPIMLEKFNILAKVELTRQINDDEKKLATSRNLSHRGDELLHEPDCNVPVQCCISPTLVVLDKDIAGSYCSEESGSELPNCSIMVEKVPQSHNALPFESHLNEERNVHAEFEENRVFEIGVDAVEKCSDTAGSESKSSTEISSATLSMQVSDDVGDKFIVHSSMKYTTSGSLEIEPSSEKDELFTESHTNHGKELGDLLVNGDLASSGVRNVEDSGLEKSALADEIKSKVPPDIDSLVEDSHSDINSALHLTRDKDTTVPIKLRSLSFTGSKKSETISTSNKNGLTIMPPRNAVPFSDEWLAAIEAAGQDILTMKSGAVQNSPPEKYLPEPSPWSPVKRKNTSIGPFDCTKFTNNLPSDSQ